MTRKGAGVFEHEDERASPGYVAVLLLREVLDRGLETVETTEALFALFTRCRQAVLRRDDVRVADDAPPARQPRAGGRHF